MRILKRILLTASAAVFALTATVTPAVPLQTQVIAEAATMKISDKSLSLREGDTWKLKVTGKGKKKVKWSSSDTSVVKVSKSGNVRAISEGNATIKARVGKKTLKCRVYVEPVDDDDDDNLANDDDDDNLANDTSYFDRLKNYINTYGTYNDDMEKHLEWTYDKDDGSRLQLDVTNSDDGDIDCTLFTGVIGDDYELNSLYSSFSINSDGNDSFVYQAMSNDGSYLYVIMNSDFNPAQYVKGGNSIDFTVVTNNAYDLTNYDLQKYGNQFFDITVSYIDTYLKGQVGFGLKELGFTSL